MYSSGPLKRKENHAFNINIIQINTPPHHIVLVGGDVPARHIYKQNLKINIACKKRDCTISKRLG
jgi:hypothetical protein